MEKAILYFEGTAEDSGIVVTGDRVRRKLGLSANNYVEPTVIRGVLHDHATVQEKYSDLFWKSSLGMTIDALNGNDELQSGETQSHRVRRHL